jgi:hypothetical protein
MGAIRQVPRDLGALSGVEQPLTVVHQEIAGWTEETVQPLAQAALYPPDVGGALGAVRAEMQMRLRLFVGVVIGRLYQREIPQSRRVLTPLVPQPVVVHTLRSYSGLNGRFSHPLHRKRKRPSVFTDA